MSTTLAAAIADDEVLRCGDIDLESLRWLAGRYGLDVVKVPRHASIEGSWFGEPEAGLIGTSVIVRDDTPVHSALHEMCHVICMDAERRESLHTNAGGDYDEENAVNYLQILLSDHIPEMGRLRMLQDMDIWGYTFRLGSAESWFEGDAEDARQWLLTHGLLTEDATPGWRLRR